MADILQPQHVETPAAQTSPEEAARALEERRQAAAKVMQVFLVKEDGFTEPGEPELWVLRNANRFRDEVTADPTLLDRFNAGGEERKAVIAELDAKLVN